MSRMIKFRAWQQYSLDMFQVTGMVWSAAIDRKFSKLELLSTDGLATVRIVTGGACDNYILMQLTGLKDCTGREIYESDIVQLFNRSLFQVVWDEYYARFQLELVQGDEYAKVHDPGMLQFSTLTGNIYEHPELLKKEGE